jgi:hypothetical protein
MKYKVDIEYSVPEFATVELDADDEGQARSEALKIFNQEYPEAIDEEIVRVNGE